MKVLAIIGSPRKGHTFDLVQRIADLLREEGPIEVETLLLGEMDIEPCRGCYACQSAGERLCPLRDDLLPLVERMKAADGVIFASPTYTGNVSSLTKRLMERMAWTAHRPQFLHQPAMLVTTASSGTRDTLRALRWFRWPGFDIVAEVGWSIWPSPRVDWVRGPRDEARLRRAARRFRAAMAHKRRTLSLARVIQFYVGKTTPSSDPRFFRADERYHASIEALGFEVPAWKKHVGEAVFQISKAWLGHALAPRSPRA